MNSLRKKTTVWILSLTATAIGVLAVSFIYLSEAIPTDPAFVETNLSQVAKTRGFNLESAIQAGYSEEEIALHLIKNNRAEFDRLWLRMLLIIGSLYTVSILLIVAATLYRETKSKSIIQAPSIPSDYDQSAPEFELHKNAQSATFTIRKNRGRFSWKQLALFTLAFPIVIFTARYMGKYAAERVNESESSHVQSQSERKIQVVVGSQDAEGVTQDQFDINFLNNLEAYTLERVKVKVTDRLKSLGYPDEGVNLTSEATYVQSGKTKLAIIRIKGPNAGNQVFISGIEGAELKRIACISTSQTTIPVSYGECGDKISDVFGSMIGK